MISSTDNNSNLKTWAGTRVPTRLVLVTAINVTIVGLLCLLVLDGGIVFRIFQISLIAHCGLISVLLSRRPQTLTPVDRLLIQFGIFPMFAVFFAIQHALS